MAETLGEAIVEIRGDLENLNTSFQQAEGTVKTKVAALGNVIKTGIYAGAAAAGAAIVAMAKTGMENMIALQDETQKFQVATGASAEEVENFSSTVQALHKQNTDSYEDLGAAVTTVRQRFGDLGDELGTQTQYFLDYAKVTGQDTPTAIRDVDATLKGFNLTLEDSPELMDKLLKAQQETGIEASKLQGALAQTAPLFNTLGMSVDESVAMLAAFEQAGVDAGNIQMGLRTMIDASTNATAEQAEAWKTLGVDVEEVDGSLNVVGGPEGALQHLISRFEQGDLTAAEMDAALVVLGRRSGTEMVRAFSQGQGAIDELTATLATSEGAVSQASATYDKQLGERWTLIRRQYLEPFMEVIGTKLLDILNWLLDKIENEWGPAIQAFWAEWGEPIMNAVSTVANYLKESIGNALDIVSGIFKAFKALFTGDWEGLKEALLQIVGALWDQVKNLFTSAANIIEGFFPGFIDNVVGFFTNLKSQAIETVQNMIDGIVEWFSPGKLLDKVMGFLNDVKDKVTGVFTGLWDRIVGHSIVPDMVRGIIAWMEELPEGMGAPTEEAAKNVSDIMDRLGSDLLLIVAQSEAFGEAFDANAAMAKTLESAIVDLLEQGLDPADERIQALKEQLNKVNEAIEGSTKAVEDNEDAWASWVETVQENVQKAFGQSRAEGDSYVGWLEATGQLTQSNLMNWNLSQIRNFEGARDELLDLIAGFYTQWSGNISDLTDEELASIQEIIDAELRGLEARGEGQSEYARTLRLLSNDIILEAQRRDRELSDLEKIQLERSREADTARWNAQVEYYNNLDQKRQEDDERQKELEQAQVERSRAAWGARYQAAADAYLEDQRLAQEQAEFDEAMYRLRVELGEAAADEMIQHDLDRLASIESTSQDAIKVIQGFHKDWSGRIGDLTDIELASLQERLQATIDYYTEKDGADSAYAVTLAALLKQITEEEQKRADEAAEYEAKQLKKRTATWREFTDSVKSALQDVLSGNKTVTEAMTALWNNVVAAAAGRVASQIKSAYDQAYTAVISGAKSAAEVIRAAFSAISLNIVDLALLVIQQIAQAFAAAREAQKKVAEEAQKLREEDLEWQGRYHELTELGFERSYGTITKTLEEEYTYFFGLLKGTASETVEVIDEATKAWIERMEALFGEFASGAVDALEEALSMDDPLDAFDAFTQGIKDQLKEQIISALVEGFLSSQVINQAVAPLLQSIDEAMASAMVGGVFDPASFENSIAPYVAELGMTLDSMGPAFEALFQVADRISGTLTNTGHYVWGDPTEGGTPIYFQPLASGGIATSPIMALIAEKKPEAVIPLDELGRFSGSTTIIVELDGRQIGRAVAPSLTKEIRVRTGMRL